MAYELKRDEKNEFLIMIPTMGEPGLIVNSIKKMMVSTTDANIHLVVVCNPKESDSEKAENSKLQIEAAVSAINTLRKKEIVLTWVQLPGPAGWTGAVNSGMSAVNAGRGFPEHVVIMNDDILVTSGWLVRMKTAFDTENIHLRSELFTYGEQYLEGDGRPAAGYGRIGMVGPVSANVAASQCIAPPMARVPASQLFTMSPDSELEAWANMHGEKNDGIVMSADFLSGFCTMYTRECLEAVCGDNANNLLMDPIFNIGGFDDNDISARAARAGYRLAIAYDAYIHHLGHQTLDKNFPSQRRGLANASRYIRKWAHVTKTRQRLVAAMRVGMYTPWDVNMMRATLERTAQVADGIAVLFTNNPNDVHLHDNFKLGEFAPDEAELIASTGADYPDKEDALRKWVRKIVPASVDIEVQYHDPDAHEWNERDERNKSIDLAEKLNPDWIISVDHDEIFEDRIDKEYMQRLMRHPNPLVSAYDIGFLTHWDTPRLHRTDSPYANGYESGMRGYRMWRVNKKAMNRIQTGTEKGLHCGNCPPFSEVGQRISGIRMRHFGYMRRRDRIRKFNRYMNWMDPNPNKRLTGGGYGHLVTEEGMQLNAYEPNNGIAFSMLMHPGEPSKDLYRHLDTVYSLVDRIIIVWTSNEKIPSDIQEIGDLFEVEWVHSPFDENASLAECRNAAIDHIHETGLNSTRWLYTLDPDEYYPAHHVNLISVRRMAEATDSLGWMFQFKNHRQDGSYNLSETVRMFKLDAERIMRYEGRVHERLESAMRQIGRNGLHPAVRYAPFIMDHFGLAKTDEQMQKKLERYGKLLAAAIMDDPTDCGHWASLALQFANDGEMDKFDKAMDIARECSGDAYLPWKISAQHAMRQAREYYMMCAMKLAPSHPYHQEVQRLCAWLQENAPDMPISGEARSGLAKPVEVDFDALLKRYEEAGASGE